MVTQAVAESDTSNSTPVGAAGGDAMRLRGIPAVSKHMGSAIPGTDPLAALLHKYDVD